MAENKFELTIFKSYVVDDVTNYTSLLENLKAATVQYNEKREQCLHNIHKKEKKLKQYQKLKRDSERKLEEVEKEYELISEEFKKGKQTILNAIRSSDDIFGLSTSIKGKLLENSILDVEEEDGEYVVSEESIERSDQSRKKRKMNEHE